MVAPIDAILPPGKKGRKGRKGRKLAVGHYVRKMTCNDHYCRVTTKRVPCRRQPEHRCVAIDGNPCAKAPKSVDCEGMFLTIVVDVTADPPQLDHARSGRRPVHTQRDVKRLYDLAP